METPLPNTAEIEDAAYYALGLTGAVRPCLVHPTITVRVGDEKAEVQAEAIALTVESSAGSLWQAADIVRVLRRQLREAAQGVCPECLAKEAVDFH